jgi:hypothetical protein
MRRKVVVAVSAMIIASQLGSPLFAEQPTVEQLGVIAGYLEANDVEALRAYLDRYPDLTEGDTALARLLRRFMVESVDLGSYLGFNQDLSDAVDDADPVDAPGGAPAEPPTETPTETPGEAIY